MKPHQPSWCFAWFAGIHKTSTERAALAKRSKWVVGSNISISFLDGSDSLQERVKTIAAVWTALANLRLIFRNDTNDTDIRITFKYPGSWSTIGTSCRKVKDKTLPTMNFGWLTEDTSDDEWKRVVLHEFGHALGMVHEHQSPAGNMQWDRNKIIADLSGPPNNWSPDVIERNMFLPYSKAETNFTNLDTLSIMTYPIPAEWTLDGFSIPLNNQLSETDKTFIKAQYP